MTPDTQLSVAMLRARAAMRGIRVDHLDGDDYAIAFRGAVVFAVGVTELRARLARMGVEQASTPDEPLAGVGMGA